MERSANTLYYYANNSTGLKHKKHILHPLINNQTIGLCGYNHEYAEVINFNTIPNKDEVCKKCLNYYRHFPIKYAKE